MDEARMRNRRAFFIGLILYIRIGACKVAKIWPN
jgi:hypothetical protein